MPSLARSVKQSLYVNTRCTNQFRIHFTAIVTNTGKNGSICSRTISPGGFWNGNHETKLCHLRSNNQLGIYVCSNPHHSFFPSFNLFVSFLRSDEDNRVKRLVFFVSFDLPADVTAVDLMKTRGDWLFAPCGAWQTRSFCKRTDERADGAVASGFRTSSPSEKLVGLPFYQKRNR